MKRVGAVARMTLRRYAKSRLLHVAGIVAILVLGAPTAYLPNVIAAARRGDAEAVQTAVEVMLNMAVSFFMILVAFIATAVGSTCVRRDLVDGTIYGVLSKPLSRTEYMVGTLLGGAAVVVFSWLVFGGALTALAALATDPLGPPEYAMLAGRCLQIVTLMCMATLLSTRFGPWVAGPLALLAFYGRETIDRLAALFELPGVVVDILKFPFPVLKALGAITERVSRSDFDPAPVLPGVIHVIDYILVMVVLACLSFRRLDLNRTSD
ncbi:MAG TPA: ABC transporter permease [Candidatus Krumholzibacteria bacterium]|nr:ABC transporter permease [Candidatus Krumholzibacteria bacterium]